MVLDSQADGDPTVDFSHLAEKCWALRAIQHVAAATPAAETHFQLLAAILSAPGQARSPRVLKGMGVKTRCDQAGVIMSVQQARIS